jgi:hypothetical protein
MISCVFPPSVKDVVENQQYLAELRDKRLKRNGCTVATRLEFVATRIASCKRPEAK